MLSCNCKTALKLFQEFESPAGARLRGGEPRNRGWQEPKNAMGWQVCESVASQWPRGAKGTPRWSKRCQKSAKNTSRGTPGTPFWHLGLQMRTFAKHRYLQCFSHISTPGGLLLGTPGTQSSSHGALTAKMDAKVVPQVPRGAPRERPGWPP